MNRTRSLAEKNKLLSLNPDQNLFELKF